MVLNKNDADGGLSARFIIYLGQGIPFQREFRLPFSQIRLVIGKDSLARLRQRTRQQPDNADAHITLAAHLLSEEPLLPSHAAEAAGELRTALRLMPPDAELGDEAQTGAMIHKFLGDALLALNQRAEARLHWQRAVALDPVSPPHGFSGPAQECLDRYPPF